MRNYPTSKIIYNHIDEIWSIDLADFSGYKTLKKVLNVNSLSLTIFQKNLWAIPQKKIYFSKNNR